MIRRQVLRELGCHRDFSITRTSLGKLHRLPRITMTASALDASHTILHNSIMKRSPVIGVVPQFFMIIGIAFARDDAPPSPVRPRSEERRVGKECRSRLSPRH